MTRAAVQIDGLPVNSQAADKGVHLVVAAAAVVVVDIANVKHDKCIAPFVPTAATRHRFHSNPEKTGPSIAMIATNHNVPIAQTTDDHAGNLYERGCAALPSSP